MFKHVEDLEYKKEIYRGNIEGGSYRFPAPPVCTHYWDEMAWIRFIDADGRWIYPESKIKS